MSWRIAWPAGLTLAVILMLLFVSGCGKMPAATEKSWDQYLASVDVQYAYEAGMLIYDIVNSELGGRTSGSDAEHEAAEILYQEMLCIGLQDVTKDAFPVDRWQFNGASLTVLDPVGGRREIKPYSYASGGTDEAGITAELLYLGNGTMHDYDGVDVEGKIVLIDIDMYWDWWVTYPTLEAALQGAAAIINSTSGGYGMLNDDAMNSQDFVGPVTIPSVNISRNDASYLKGLLEEGPVTVNLIVDNVVEKGGTSYNIVGKIPGKNPHELIIIGDHYDAHFWGFQDNLMAVGLTLAIAKGMIDSGYQPERTLVFVLHGAEEYGAIDTRYDWSIGAWNQIFTVRPDWVGKALAYINFELPAYEFESSTYVASTPELYSFLKEFIASAPQPEGAFPDGIRDEGQMQTSWADNFSYNIAGVPAMHNGFLEDADREAYPFYENIYHSNFDLPDIYNQAVLDFNLRFYGALAIALDQDPALALDFRHQADWLEDAVDTGAFELAGLDLAPLLEEIAALRVAAGKVYEDLHSINSLFQDLRGNGDGPPAELWQQATALNRETLAIFKTFQDKLLRLDWEDVPIVGHQQPQDNILLLTEAIDLLQEGDVNTVIDEILWQIDGNREWISYSFSREVADYFIWQVFDPSNSDNLFWGAGRIVGYVDLYDVLQALMARYDQEKPDLSAEIAALEKALESQIEMLARLADEEARAVRTVREMLEAMDTQTVLAAVNEAAK
ncbi:MAG TPA: M28 family peptidase [Firmicutes bacterium]|nr:M28 family peptidase [Bacillota bacterium]